MWFSIFMCVFFVGWLAVVLGLTQTMYQSKAAADTEQHELDTLSTTAAVLATSAKKLAWITYDNSANAAITYLKIRDAATYTHGTHAASWVFEIPAGARGSMTFTQIGQTGGISLGTGCCVAASSGSDTSGGAPASAFDCVVGLN